MQFDEYLEAEVLTASSEKLHLMVVNAAVNSVKLGLNALKSKQFEQAHYAFSEARDLVAELLGGLNPHAMPETVQNLKMLFAFAYQQLAVADIQQSVQAAQNALDVLVRHQECWYELLALTKSTNSPSANTSSEPERFAGVDSTELSESFAQADQTEYSSHRHDAGAGMQWEC